MCPSSLLRSILQMVCVIVAGVEREWTVAGSIQVVLSGKKGISVRKRIDPLTDPVNP